MIQSQKGDTMSSNTQTAQRSNVKTYAALGVLVAGGLGLMFSGGNSGADFTATDKGDVTVSTGELTLALTNGNLDYPNLAPGTSKTDTFTVTNTGSVASEGEFEFVLDSASVSGLTAADAAELKVSVNGSAPVSAVAAVNTTFDLGTLTPGQAKNVDVTFSLDSAAGNEWQNKSASGDGVVTLRQG